MNTTLWALIGGALFTVMVAFGGYRAGEASAGLDCAAKQALVTDKIITQQRVIIKEIPKIITKYVADTTTIERTYETTIKELPDVFDANCTMPKRWGELFVNAANGRAASDPGSATPSPASYGCLETAKATLSDLKAGSANTAQLTGLIPAAKLIGGK